MKKKIFVLLVIVVLLFISWLLLFCFRAKNTVVQDNEYREEVILNEYVNTIDNINLYVFDENKYTKIGFVGSGVLIHIGEYNNGYYKVYDLDRDYYIKSDNLINSDIINSYNDRYKNYILYNYNVVTNNETSLFDEDGNLIYKFDVSMSFPIIINEPGKYGVEYNNRLLYIIDNDVKVEESYNTDLHNIKGIGVLNYHFFYDDSIAEERMDCNQIICTSKIQFREHLDYIKNNDFFTPTMKELEMYIDGKIRLPKSVVITIDDGWRADLGIKMLTEYEINATMFLVTSWADPSAFRTNYVEVHSHSDNMHNPGVCPIGQGGGIQCLDEDVIIDDLKRSSEKLNGSTVFCYPYYEFNDYSIEMLKKAGYTMAFAGESVSYDMLVKVGSNKYKLPRFSVVKSTNINKLIDYLNV